MRTTRRRIITAAAIAAAVLATGAATAAADTGQQLWTVTDNTDKSWSVVDDTIHGINGQKPSEICIYAPGDTSPCGAAARARARTARSTTTRRKQAKTITRRHTRTSTHQATPITRRATPTSPRHVAGNRRWRPAVGCQPITRTGWRRTTRVVKGGTLWSISQCTGTSVSALQDANPWFTAHSLQPGDIVTIPGSTR